MRECVCVRIKRRDEDKLHVNGSRTPGHSKKQVTQTVDKTLRKGKRNSRVAHVHVDENKSKGSNAYAYDFDCFLVSFSSLPPPPQFPFAYNHARGRLFRLRLA